MELFTPWHLAIILLILLLLFGPKRLPDLARGIGEAIREFKKSMNSGMEEEKKPEVKAEIEPPNVEVKK